MKTTVLMTILAAGLVGPAAAQDPADTRQAMVANELIATAVQPRPAMAVQSRITTGAPYSAEAVTESHQVLADGNRIARKTVTRIYRDGDGRTRREELDPQTGVVRTVTISDPIAHSTYTLVPANRIAYQARVLIATPAGAGGFGLEVARSGGGGTGGATDVRQRSSADAAGHSGASVSPVPPPPPPPPGPVGIAEGQAPPLPLPPPMGGTLVRSRVSGDNSQTTSEDLGQEMIEGVLATGQRTTTVIPAGAIGNAQPIQIVSEQWMSPDLKVLVLTKHSDPRAAATTYRLSNIVRAEPDRSLFVVPPDYTVKEQSVRQQPPPR